MSVVKSALEIKLNRIVLESLKASVYKTIAGYQSEMDFSSVGLFVSDSLRVKSIMCYPQNISSGMHVGFLFIIIIVKKKQKKKKGSESLAFRVM